jgi:hypothetical protein
MYDEWGPPDVPALHLRQTKLSALNHSDEIFDRCVELGHERDPRFEECYAIRSV